MTDVIAQRVEVAPGVALHVLRWPGQAGAVPFLLVHGLASNALLWVGVAQELSARGHDVAAVDLRGHGRSDAPEDGYGLATAAADLVAVVAGLGLDRPVVVGQSWGGNLALELAAAHPGVARGIACVDGGTIDLQASFPDWAACEAALTPPDFAGAPAAGFEARLRAAHPDWPEVGIAGTMGNVVVGEDGTVAPRLRRDHHLAILCDLWEQRPGTRYPQVEVPVLLLPAGSGGHLHAALEAARTGLVHGRVHPFPEADHDVHAQRPSEVAAVLAQAWR